MSSLALAAVILLSQADAVDAGVRGDEAPADVSPSAAAPSQPPAPAPGPTASDAPKQPEVGASPRAQENQPQAAGANPPTAVLGEWWKKFTPFGYVKTGVFYTFPFTSEQLIGSNGGFRILTARMGVEFNPVEALSVVASIEIGAPNLRPDDPLAGNRVVEARDAYLEYRPFRALWVRAGQFKAPFNGETLLGDADLPFITRSIVTDGANPPEAHGPPGGLTLGRQVGLQISSDRLGGESLGFRYYLAAVNGNGQNQLFNDSNPVAPVARAEVEILRMVNVGINGYYNVRTEGVRPNRLNVNQLGYGADASVRISSFRALVGFLGRNNTYSTPLPNDSGLGFFAQAHYVLDSLGLEGALRFAWIDPSSAQAQDREWDLSALVGYRFKAVPLRVVLQYTHRDEEAAVAVQNESVDLMAQVTW